MLEKLDFSQQGNSETTLETIKQEIMANESSLIELNLHYNLFGKDRLMSIFKDSPNLPTLKIIDLSNNQLTHTAIPFLRTLVEKAPFLEEVDLSNNGSFDNNFSSLCEILSKLEYLKKLRLNGLNLSDIKPLANLILHATSLHEVDISSNQIQFGMIDLAAALSRNDANLKILSIRDNKNKNDSLFPLPYKPLITIIQKNQSLEYLDLTGSVLQIIAKKALDKAMDKRDKKHLKVIYESKKISRETLFAEVYPPNPKVPSEPKKPYFLPSKRSK